MAKTPNVAAANALKPARTPDNPDIAIVRASALWSGERRLDGESYLTEGYRIRGQIEAELNTRRLDAVAAVWQPSRLKGTQVGRKNGVPFLTATQVFDIQPRPRKWLAKGRTPDFERRFVSPGMILLTCSGSVGDAIVSYSPLENTLISHDILRVQTHQQSDFGYLYAFLRTRFGRAMLRSTRYGSIVKHLEPEHVADIPVPVASDEIRESANQQTRNVFKLRDEAFVLIREAEKLFEAHVGAPSSSQDWWFSVSSEAIARGRRRLDGYYHNAKVKEIVGLLVQRGIEVMPLSSVCERVFGVARFKHVYQETGIPYIDSEDLFKINPELIKFIPASTMPHADKYYVDSGWLLMASSGQLYGLNGSVVLAGDFHERKIISNHVCGLFLETFDRAI